MSPKHWLMKAEPDSRVVKEKDVKFSVDDFEQVKTTPWEGVRNAEARNLMKEMKVGDKVLFYHSNCKAPGIAAFAEIAKEAYPDYTAWDSSHPYYDTKTDKANPKWYMVDVTFVARATHFVPLALLRQIAAASASEPPSDVAYIEEDGVNAIKQMALVNRGRLSVQRVEENAWGVIELLAEKGGWDESVAGPSKAKGKKAAATAKKATPRVGAKRVRKAKAAKKDEDEEDAEDLDDTAGDEKKAIVDDKKHPSTSGRAAGRKRKAKDVEDTDGADVVDVGLRRSTRTRK